LEISGRNSEFISMPVKDIGVVDIQGWKTKFVSLKPSQDTSPVYVHIKGQTLRIPRDYIVNAFIMPRTRVSLTTGHWGKLHLHLMTVFPTFSSATSMNLQLVEDVLNAVKTSSTEKANLISITRMIDDSISRWRKFAENYRVASGDEMANLWTDGLSETLRLNTGSYDDALIICCSEHHMIKGWQDLIEISPGILYSCGFNSSLLPHWQEVHASLKGLLRSFSLHTNDNERK
jgi:hypothetical protein